MFSKLGNVQEGTATKRNAWIVVVENEENAEFGINFGKLLKREGTKATLLALVLTSISFEMRLKLQEFYDVLKMAEDNAKLRNPIEMECLSEYLQLEKFIVLRPWLIQTSPSINSSSENTSFAVKWKKIGDKWNKYIIPLEKLENILSNINDDIHHLGMGASDIARELEFMMKDDDEKDEYLAEIENSLLDCVCVIGMSCRFPQANSLEEYWDILENGINTSSPAPSHRLGLTEMDPLLNANFLKCSIDEFDADFFEFSPNEASFIDPQARLLLEVSWEAFLNAGINPESIRGTKTGVFLGSWMQDYWNLLNQDGVCGRDNFLRKYLSNSFGSCAAKLSFFYGLCGPNISTESGCSSSMVAVDLAIKSLQRKECPIALACGANIILHLGEQERIWAPDGKSKSFDLGANGYGRGEGIAVLVLKQYRQAIKDGDNIYGIIRGSGVSQEGLSKSFGSPTVESEYCAMNSALYNAKLDPCQVDYVEAHATGTSVGDPIEAAAILKAYSCNKHTRAGPLWVGSGKTNIGHTEACSGLAGIIKVILAMQKEKIPGHLNLTVLNPQVDFSTIPGEIALTTVPWPRKMDRARIAGVSSFGVTGTDVHMIIQEPPPPQQSVRDVTLERNKLWEHQGHLLTLSAKCEPALIQLKKSFSLYLETTTDSLENITATANLCRPTNFPYRIAVLAKNNLEMAQKLSLDNDPIHRTGNKPVKICMSFPGKLGKMDLTPFRLLYNTVPYFKKTLDLCSEIFQEATKSKSTLVSHLWENAKPVYGPEDRDWYLLMPTLQYCLAKLWIHWGLQPTVVLGHCFGELSAALVCGALDLKDFYSLRGIIKHFFASEKELPAGMMVIQTNRVEVEQLIENFLRGRDGKDESIWIDVACANSPRQTVVASTQDGIKLFREYCSSHGYRCKLLEMEFGAHSRAIETGCKNSLEIFRQVTTQAINIPYISSVTGNLVSNGEMNEMFFFNIFRNPVNFTDACAKVSELGLADIYLEIGMDGAFTKLTRENLQNQKNTLIAMPTFSPNGILDTLANLYQLGVNFQWDNIYDQKAKFYKMVTLPNYPFQKKKFWLKSKPQPKNINGFVPWQNIHPLLGYKMESPLGHEGNIIAFKSHLSCKDETSFIRDHMIGDKVIFPGAGYLEMILSAWKYSNDIPNSCGLAVKNLIITKPLYVPKDTSIITQCVLNKETKTVEIYSLENMTSSWQKHATGQVTKFDSTPYFYDFDCFTENSIISSPLEFYARAKIFGLNLTGSFQLIEQIYHLNGDDEVIFELKTITSNRLKLACPIQLLDALIQCWMIIKMPLLESLYVPIGCPELKLYPHKNTTENGQYCITWKKGSDEMMLHEMTEGHVASMKCPEFAATSAESVLCAAGCKNLKPKKDNIPVNLYLDTWERSHFAQELLSPIWSDTKCTEIELSELTKSLAELNPFSPEEIHLDQSMNKFCALYVLQALCDLGWTHEIGLDILMKNKAFYATTFGVLPSLHSAFKHFLTFLDARLLDSSIQDVEGEIHKILECPPVKSYAAIETVHECGKNLAMVLKGTADPQRILFETNLAQNYYEKCRFNRSIIPMQRIYEFILKTSNKNFPIRILEIGAGTGVFSKGAVEIVSKLKLNWEYHFTDISRDFVSKGSKLFSLENIEHINFATLDIEKEPLSQGFPSNYFDIVIAFDVLHATMDLSKTLRNVALMTKLGGRILLGEINSPIREADICFGTLPGFWLFDDQIRVNHCSISADQWLDILARTGFADEPISVLSCADQKAVISARKSIQTHIPPGLSIRKDWILFQFGGARDVEQFKAHMEISTGRSVTSIILDSNLMGSDLNDLLEGTFSMCKNSLEGILIWLGNNSLAEKNFRPSYRRILEPILYLMKNLIKSKIQSKVFLITEGCWAQSDDDVNTEQSATNGMAWGFMRSARLEMSAFRCKSIDLESCLFTTDTIFQLVTELFLDDKETEIMYRGGRRFVRRLKKKKEKGQSRSIPESCHFHLQLPTSNLISQVKFEDTLNDTIEEPLGDNQVMVQVHSVALNFKDVLSIMQPSTDFSAATNIGIDYSGIVMRVGNRVKKLKVGDPVFGLALDKGCMKSHVPTDENLLIAKPNNLNFSEVATLPAVFLTAWWCMVSIAKMKANQTILIHATSGGVGLAAIQIAKLLGVNVIGTAGNGRKKNFLKKLGIEHVFSSRNLEYKQKILELTEGQGVDVVLNCLTGPGFKEASLDVCRDGGHFVEISKLEIWNEQEVKLRKPSVSYSVVDLTCLPSTEIIGMLEQLDQLLETGQIKPLAHVRFPATEIVQALTYLQRAKHIGKVIVDMPTHTNLFSTGMEFSDSSTYIITGGMGAIGFAICKWMIRKGAKYMVLLGRSDPSEEVYREILQLGEDFGAKIVHKRIDVSEFAACEQLIRLEIPERFHWPPVRGIHHCAGVLSDKLIANQTWRNMEYVLKGKVDGAWNLHILTKDMNLEHFVMHSSAVSTFGNEGQCSHAAANIYLDVLAQYRRSINLPALSVNWGQWKAGLAENARISWLSPFSLEDGIKTLERLLSQQHLNWNVVAGNFNFSQRLKYSPFLKNLSVNPVEYLESEKGNKLLDLYMKQIGNLEKMEATVKKFVFEMVSNELGITSEQTLDEDMVLSEIGLDSLMRLQLEKKLELELQQKPVKNGCVICLQGIETLKGLIDLVTNILERAVRS